MTERERGGKALPLSLPLSLFLSIFEVSLSAAGEYIPSVMWRLVSARFKAPVCGFRYIMHQTHV